MIRKGLWCTHSFREKRGAIKLVYNFQFDSCTVEIKPFDSSRNDHSVFCGKNKVPLSFLPLPTVTICLKNFGGRCSALGSKKRSAG